MRPRGTIFFVLASSFFLPSPPSTSQPSQPLQPFSPPFATRHPSAGNYYFLIFFFFFCGIFLFFHFPRIRCEIPSHPASFFSFFLSPTTITTWSHPSHTTLMSFNLIFFFFLSFFSSCRMAQVQLAVSIDNPEIIYPIPLALDEAQIAAACGELLQFLDEPPQQRFRVKYRIELLPNQNGKSLSISNKIMN